MKVNEMHLTRTNRIFYINDQGELFVQFRPDKHEELETFRNHLENHDRIYYYEKLVSGNSICGTVTRVTKSGLTLKDWSVR